LLKIAKIYYNLREKSENSKNMAEKALASAKGFLKRVLTELWH
jgi:ribosome-binding factor A